MSDVAICIIAGLLLGLTWLSLRGMSAEEKRRRTLPRTQHDVDSSISSGSGQTHEARP